MGQKVHPNGLRLGYIKDWNSIWYADSDTYADKLIEDIQVRDFIKRKLSDGAVSRVIIERPAENVKITVQSGRPGVIIGKKGEDLDKLRAKLSKMVGVPVNLNIEEVRKPELDAKLVADTVAQQLEKRVMFRRAMKRAVQSAMKLGAKGVKITVSGRLGGAEIARSEWHREGRVPLHTLRADIDYALSEALTTYGIIGVKVWIFKGEVLSEAEQAAQPKQAEGQRRQRNNKKGTS